MAVVLLNKMNVHCCKNLSAVIFALSFTVPVICNSLKIHFQFLLCIEKTSGTIYSSGRQKISTRLGVFVCFLKVNDRAGKQKSNTKSSFKNILIHQGYTTSINECQFDYKLYNHPKVKYVSLSNQQDHERE